MDEVKGFDIVCKSCGKTVTVKTEKELIEAIELNWWDQEIGITCKNPNCENYT